MKWEGFKLKQLVDSREGIKIQDLAESLKVSRQTFNDWVNGQIPKANHLVQLSKIFNVDPDYFFSATNDILIPVHRLRKTAKLNEDMKQSALELASKYETIFKNDLNYKIIMVNRLTDLSETAAICLANELRGIAEIEKDLPLNLEGTFRLLNETGVYTIFTNFPDEIKSYAFFTKIHEHRVIFFNNSTNALDLIFPLIHELVHAIRDESKTPDEQAEEDFCDMVASYIQFPQSYIEFNYNSIKNLSPSEQIHLLKNFSKKNTHSIHGIVKRIKNSINSKFSLSVGGADTILKKNYPSIGDLLSKNGLIDFVDTIKNLSPNYFNIISDQIDSLTTRNVAELFSVEYPDASEIKKEVLRLKEKQLTSL